MNVLETIKNLETSKEYKEWKKSYKKTYLAHAFTVLDEKTKGWEIGYYNPDTNLITVFTVVDEKITRNPDAEVFKEQEKLVSPLDFKKVKIDGEKALENAKKILDENYKGNIVFKTFMILQHIDKLGQVWNITFVTEQFKTINIKLDAASGDCKDHKIVSLMQGREEK